MLKYRLPSGITLLTLLLTSIFWESAEGKIIFTIFGVGMVGCAVWEFTRMLKQIGKEAFTKTTIGLSVALVVSTLYSNSGVIPFALLVLTISLPWILLLYSKQDKDILFKAINSLATFYMITVPLIFISLIYVNSEFINNIDTDYSSRYLLFYMILVTKFGDIGAYFSGMTANKILNGNTKKIVPSISPKKTWIGTFGGFCSSILVSILLVELFLPEQLGHYFSFISATLIGATLFIGGFFGDLVESALKRLTGVKDSGTILPGMGGVLDVVDSLLLNAPIFYLIIKFVL
jgi:phosphatidate cytidylyltransferase